MDTRELLFVVSNPFTVLGDRSSRPLSPSQSTAKPRISFPLRYYNPVPEIVNSADQPRGFQRLWRTLKQLFYEITGALFAVVAFAWLNAAFRSWTRDVAHWLIATAIGVAAMFTIFATIAFRKSRRI